MKTMKKLILGVGVGMAVAGVINYMILKNAGQKATKEENEKYYEWKFGKIRYIEKGEGKPILLLHSLGIGSSLFEWKETIENLSKHKFSISTGEEKTDYSTDYTVWPSIREFEDNEEAMELRKKLRDLFTSYTNVAEMSLDKLRRIKAIIDEH